MAAGTLSWKQVWLGLMTHPSFQIHHPHLAQTLALGPGWPSTLFLGPLTLPPIQAHFQPPEPNTREIQARGVGVEWGDVERWL